MTTRDEHMVWCKKRALEYLNRGDVKNAITSMLSDLAKHDGTKGVGDKMTMLGIVYAAHGDFDGARRFIEGFR